MKILGIALLMAALMGYAQDPPKPALPVQVPDQNTIQQQELLAALGDANNSPPDVTRVLEAFLKKYPETPQRVEIERALAKTAIDTKDDRRMVLYGERVLALSPDDILTLDRVAYSLLALGGRENSTKAFKYAQSLERLIGGLPPPDKDAARLQDERDHARARALLYESRAKTNLGEKDEAERLAAQSFSIYPTEDAAREWSETLDHLGRKEDAVAHLADAFAIPDAHSSDADRAVDRRRLGELYRQIHGSEQGLGDVILAAYDRTSGLAERRRDRLRGMDPNLNATDPMQFTVTGLDGKKLPLANLKGNIVVLDFWATWCGPCRAQHPMYETVRERFGNRNDVVFLSIDGDEDHALVAPFLDQQKWSRDRVYFEDGLSRLLQVAEIPTTILFDKRGRVASRMKGFIPERFVDQLTERIQSALAESN